MNIALVLLALGGILLIESVMLLFCLAFSFFTESYAVSDFSWPMLWLECLIPTLLSACILIFMGRKADREHFFRREAFAIVSLGWLVSGLYAALPYAISPLGIPVWDALFESYSGLTTTGATIFTDLNQLPDSLILWRSITQWMGGLGIVILFVAVLGFFGIGNKALFNRETSALADSDMGTRFQSLSFKYLLIYIGITVVGIIGLVICGLTPFNAINHTMAAVSTGGFSPHNESVAYYPQLSVHLWLTLIMLAGGVAFPVHYILWIQKRIGFIKRNEEFKAYFCIIFLVTSIIALDLLFYWPDRTASTTQTLVDSLFQTVSIMTTTGFATANFDVWPPLSKFLLLGVMFIGGCAGSTAGGIKVSRFIVFAKAARRHLQLVQRPHLVSKLRLNGKVLSEDAIQGVIIFMAFYFVLLLIGILGLALLEPNLKLTSTLSAVIACLNNIGPGLGQVGPTENFALFNPAGKMWLAAFMLIGRLEIYAVLLLLMPSFWKKF
jgi:trk system potassium uptake protein TrkH